MLLPHGFIEFYEYRTYTGEIDIIYFVSVLDNKPYI